MVTFVTKHCYKNVCVTDYEYLTMIITFCALSRLFEIKAVI